MKKFLPVFFAPAVIFIFAGCSNTSANNGDISSETSAVSKINSTDEHNKSQTDSSKETTTMKKMNTMGQMEDNISYMKEFVPYTKEEFDIVEKAAKIIRKSATVSCTGCRYCTEICPKDIPIPNYLGLLQPGFETTQVVYYFNYSQGHGKAGDCIGSRQCERHSLQHIPIMEHLKNIAQRFYGFKGYR